jgi:arginyl-tRNA synthetase
VIPALCLIGGILIGYFAAEKNTQHDLYRSYTKGLWEGMSRRKMETQLLRNRVTELEAEARKVAAVRLRNAMGRPG